VAASAAGIDLDLGPGIEELQPPRYRLGGDAPFELPVEGDVAYALIASFLLDTASVFAAAIGAVEGSFLAKMIQPNIR